MTIITMNLPDDMVRSAKAIGVLNENTLKDIVMQFLTKKIDENKVNTTWADYLDRRDLSAIPVEFMADRQQPVLEQRELF